MAPTVTSFDPDYLSDEFTLKEIAGFSADQLHPEMIGSRDNTVTSKIIAKSIPITQELKDNITRLQLSTISHDQGFGDHDQGSWSWFELSILEDKHADKVKLNTDGFEMTWRSHTNRIAHAEFAQYFGFMFDQSSLLLQSLEVSLLQLTTRVDPT